jgi:hypothetical protein
MMDMEEEIEQQMKNGLDTGISLFLRQSAMSIRTYF